MKRIFKLSLVAVLLPVLSGCFGLYAGALVGGAMSIADRRSFGAQTDDETIELRVSNEIGQRLNKQSRIVVVSYNRLLLLTGVASSKADLTNLESIVKDQSNIRAIYNTVVISPDLSLLDRSSDATLTAKVKTALIAQPEISAEAVKVVTERNTVYLMGIVTDREGAYAAAIASRISGVQKVVKIFEYVSEAQLKILQPLGKEKGKEG